MGALSITSTFVDTTVDGFSVSYIATYFPGDKLSLEGSQYVLRSPGTTANIAGICFTSSMGNSFCAIFGSVGQPNSPDTFCGIVPNLHASESAVSVLSRCFGSPNWGWWLVHGRKHVVESKERMIVVDFTVPTGSDLLVTIAVYKPGTPLNEASLKRLVREPKSSKIEKRWLSELDTVVTIGTKLLSFWLQWSSSRSGEKQKRITYVQTTLDRVFYDYGGKWNCVMFSSEAGVRTSFDNLPCGPYVMVYPMDHNIIYYLYLFQSGTIFFANSESQNIMGKGPLGYMSSGPNSMTFTKIP